MHEEDEELALNAKAIGLAIGGAIVAGLLFVLARRDDTKPSTFSKDHATAVIADEIERSGKEAKRKQKSLKKSVEKHAAETKQRAEEIVAHGEVDARTAERDLKAAAWDALQEAKAAESRMRTASSRVAEDAAHLASRLTHEAKSLAEEGKGRLGHLRHRDDIEFSAQEEIAKLREELALLRDQSSGGRRARKELSALASKITRNSGLEPNSVAADALAAGLDHLERTLKAKAPDLLAAKDRRQATALLQSELVPLLRDSLIQGATAAFSSWEAARGASPGIPMPKPQSLQAVIAEAPRQVARAMHRSQPEAEPDVSANAEEPEVVAWQVAGTPETTNEPDRNVNEVIETAPTTESAEASTAVAEARDDAENDRHGKAGWLWGAAGLGLGIYALADQERREQFLKLANEATVLAQELLRDLQGYDDEFA